LSSKSEREDWITAATSLILANLSQETPQFQSNIEDFFKHGMTVEDLRTAFARLEHEKSDFERARKLANLKHVSSNLITLFVRGVLRRALGEKAGFRPPEG